MAEKLEDKVGGKESEGYIKKALNTGFNIAVAGGTTLFGMATVGIAAPIVGGALAAGNAIGGVIKKKSFYKNFNDSINSYSIINSIFHPIVWLGDVTIPLIPNETLFGKALRTLYGMTLYNAAFVGMFRSAHHLIGNKLNPKGITKAITDDFYNMWKRTGIGFAPAYALVTNGITNLPFGYFGIEKMPVFALNALPFGIYHTVKPLAPKQSYQASYSPEYSPAHQLA